MTTFEQLVESSYIRKYLRYVAASEDISLAEAARKSLKIVKDHVDNPDVHVLIMSAFRHDWDKGDLLNNYRICKAKNASLKQEFRYLGWFFYPVVGVWVEDGVKVDEDSFFVVVHGEDPDAFLNAVLRLVKAYKQDGALYRLAGHNVARGLNWNGTIDTYGVWKENNLADYYTKLRGSSNIGLHAAARDADSKNRKLQPKQRHKQKFTFEGVGTESRVANMQAHYYDKAIARGATRPRVSFEDFLKGIRPN